MKRRALEDLIETIANAMQDERLDLPAIAEELYQELRRRARAAQRWTEEYSTGEAEFWIEAACDAERFLRPEASDKNVRKTA